VFVCDTPVFIEHYDRLFELLVPSMRVLCLELPGMGFSRPAPGFDFTLRSQANAVLELLQSEGVQKCVLAFSCVGAYMALLLAATAPALVQGVVCIQAPSWSEEKAWARRIDFGGRSIVATPVLGQLVVRAGKRAIAGRWFDKALGPAADKAHFIATASSAFDAGSPWALASMVQSYFGRADPVLQAASQKALVLWGAQDRTHRRTNKQSSLAYFPDAEVVTFDDAGHCPELEYPDRFAATLRNFMHSL